MVFAAIVGGARDYARLLQSRANCLAVSDSCWQNYICVINDAFGFEHEKGVAFERGQR